MDVNKIIGNVLGDVSAGAGKVAQTAKQSGATGGLLGGAAAGGLVALLMTNKKARKFGGKALTYGGLAAVGGLAYKAWSDHKAAQQGVPSAVDAAAVQSAADIPPAPSNSAFDLSHQKDRQGSDLRLTLVRAMISSAKSDGHIDGDEYARIQEQISAMDLNAEEKAFLFDQLNAPSDPIAIARLANGDEQAAEIYVASAIAVDVDTPEERRYLDRLSDALLLPEDLRARLDGQVARTVNVEA